MLRENDIKNVRKLFNRHHYVMTTAELLEAKLYYADIKQLLDEGFIERIRRGYYHWIENCEAREIVIINSLFPDAVLCMETALFYYEYSDRNPAEWNFAIDRNVSKLRTNIEYPFIKAYRIESNLVTLGETTGEIDFTKVTAACIGKQTKAAADALGMKTYVAASATMDALTDLVRQILNR